MTPLLLFQAAGFAICAFAAAFCLVLFVLRPTLGGAAALAAACAVTALQWGMLA